MGYHFHILLMSTVEVHRGKGFSTKIANLKTVNIFGKTGYLYKRARITSIIARGNDVIRLKIGKELAYGIHPEIYTKLNDVLISILVNRLEGMNDKVLNCSSGALCYIRISAY
jgi:hypothetical protein